MTYTLAVISSLALYEYPSSEGGIVAGCGPRTFWGIHQWKHEDYQRKRMKNAENLKGLLWKNAEILKEINLVYAENLNTY